jgi:predicted nuclease with TOPRIM domain
VKYDTMEEEIKDLEEELRYRSTRIETLEMQKALAEEKLTLALEKVRDLKRKFKYMGFDEAEIP